MNFKPLFLLLVFPLIGNLNAQDTIPYNDFDKVTESVAKLSTEKNYHEAYLQYEKVIAI